MWLRGRSRGGNFDFCLFPRGFFNFSKQPGFYSISFWNLNLETNSKSIAIPLTTQLPRADRKQGRSLGVPTSNSLCWGLWGGSEAGTGPSSTPLHSSQWFWVKGESHIPNPPLCPHLSGSHPLNLTISLFLTFLISKMREINNFLRRWQKRWQETKHHVPRDRGIPTATTKSVSVSIRATGQRL